jgi:flagellar basal-body rod protein FlgB
MGMDASKYTQLAHEALRYRKIRADLIAGNIANIDTPFYKAKDIGFERVLLDEADRLSKKTNSKLHMAKTNAMHLSGIEEDGLSEAVIFFRPNHATRNDGNSVDLDIETTEMSKNSIMINAITAALKKRSQLLKAVIDSSART